MMISTYSKFCSLCAINRIINVHKERRETERNLGGRSKKMSITIRNCKKSVDCLCDNCSNLQIPPTNIENQLIIFLSKRHSTNYVTQLLVFTWCQYNESNLAIFREV